MKYVSLWPLVLWNIGHDLEVQGQEWVGQFPSINSTEDRVAEKMMTPWAAQCVQTHHALSEPTITLLSLINRSKECQCSLACMLNGVPDLRKYIYIQNHTWWSVSLGKSIMHLMLKWWMYRRHIFPLFSLAFILHISVLWCHGEFLTIMKENKNKVLFLF